MTDLNVIRNLFSFNLKMLNAIEDTNLIKRIRRVKKILIPKEVFLLLELIYIGLCLSGLLYQTDEITNNYFHYEVESTIKIKLPGEETPLAIAIGVDLYKSVDIEQVIKFISDRKELIIDESDERSMIEVWKISRWITSLKSNKLTDQISAIADAAEEYLTLGHFLNYTYAETLCLHGECIKTHFIINTDVCFRWVPLNVVKIRTETNLYGGNNVPLFVVAAEIVTKTTYFALMLNRIDKLPRSEYVQATKTAFPSDPKVYVFAYSYNISRLKAPYADDCFNYEPKYEDRNDAIADCVNEETKNRTGRISLMKMFNNTSSDINLHLQMFDSKGVYYSKDDMDLQHNMSMGCKRTFHRPDCETENKFTVIRTNGSAAGYCI